jgi:hypothetical protein
MLRLRAIFLACLPLFAAAQAGAAILHYRANITHAQEVGTGAIPLTTSTGAPRPLSFGKGDFFIDTTLHMMTMTVTIFNIDVTGSQTPDTFDNLTNAHIHAPAPPGVNAGVRWGFVGTPCHDLPPPCAPPVAPVPGGVGGTYTLTWDAGEGAGVGFAATEAAILAGLSYINFHTVQFGGGEIRGQIVPEPGALALLGIGALGLIPALRRRR